MSPSMSHPDLFASPAGRLRERIGAVFAADSGESLALFLSERLPQLHYAITLLHDPSQGLKHIETYIRLVPDFIDAIASSAREYGFYEAVAPLLEVCVAYFLSPPADISEAHTRLGLLDEAYVAHRVLEEINDRLMSRTGAPLIPMDTSTVNLVMHDFIGEPFANQLDAMAMTACDQVFNALDLQASALGEYLDHHAREGWDDTLARWPSLAQDFGVRLSFKTGSDPLQ